MEYAVVKINSKQFKLSPGDEIKIDAKLGEKDKKISFDEVLLINQDDKVKIGQPKLDAKVVGTVLGHSRGKKIKLFTYKAKTGQHRHAGHRQDQTTVRIETIEG